MSTEAPCRKAIHNPAEGGYLHGPDDDTPYTVDGVEYCGRCHRALPEHEYGDEAMSTEAKIKHTPLDLTQFKALVESLEQFDFTSLCEQGHNVIAEHIRNRRLLEAGAGMVQPIKDALDDLDTLEPAASYSVESIDPLRSALAAYQEAAKA